MAHIDMIKQAITQKVIETPKVMVLAIGDKGRRQNMHPK